MKIHPQFKFNGQSFSKSHLSEIAYSLVKEGKPFEKPLGDFMLDWFDAKDTIMVNTSGSTGTPKPIRLKKRYMANSALATASFFKLKAGDTALLCLPTDYIAGKMMLVRAMVLGLELDVVEPTSHPLQHMSKPYDFCAMVPLQAEQSLPRLHQLKKLIIGGAPVPHRLQQELSNTTALCYETYGMTETITHIAAKQLNGFKDNLEYQDVFKVMENVAIRSDGRGCLVVDAPKVSDASVRTNDLIEILDQDTFKWLGRYDNIINSGGIKLQPEQIESKLATVLGTRYFIAGVPDPALGEKLILVIEGQEDKENVLKGIRSLKSISKYEVPKSVYFVPKFIETTTGKIQRSKTIEAISM